MVLVGSPVRRGFDHLPTIRMRPRLAIDVDFDVELHMRGNIQVQPGLFLTWLPRKPRQR